jgi:2-C-methyl-D-erythritol 4-phosphate cytidylyltransferase
VHGYEKDVQDIVDEYHLTKVQWITEGGKTFQESVFKGLLFLRDKCSFDDIVMIHMSVAPFVDDSIIDDALRVCREKGNAISKNECLLCMGSRDTDEFSTKSVLRENIIGLNTPQVFIFGELLNDYLLAQKEGYLDTLEPHTTSLEYHLGKTLYFSKGSQLNIKITNEEDLDLFEAFCIMKQRRGESR